MTVTRSLLALAAGLALCAGASAQVVITHAKALAGNVTPGDAPGYPVTISQPGAYRLASNLNVPVGHGVEITASNVSIDLNGFTLSGPNSCSWSGYVVSCTHSAGSYGILTYQGVFQTRLANGQIRGFGGGATLASGTVSNVTFAENSVLGLFGSELSVTRSVASLNGTDGFRCDACLIVNSIAERNGENGFSSFVQNQKRLHVTGSSATRNGNRGVSAALVRDTAMVDNGAPTNRSMLQSAGGNVDESGVF